MKVEYLKLIQFRNYDSFQLKFNDGLTIFQGRNAQGKTNIAEAIYLCATGRSHRTKRDSELVKWDTQGAYIRCDINKGSSQKIEIRLPLDGKKQVKIDNSSISKMGELMGNLNAVMFSPEDLRLIKDGPSERRRFMDVELSQMSRAYFYYLANYQRVISQRNALLKDIERLRAPASELGAWDEQMGILGANIYMQRRAFICKLSKTATLIHKGICQSEALEIGYISDISADSLEDAQNSIMEMLDKQRQDDIKKGATSCGVHRDDISIFVNGINMRLFGSQGQQRTAALSMKLSELELMKEETGHEPVLLLDDVLSELDDKRQKMLLEAVVGYQTILTCTLAPQKIKADVYTIEDAKVNKPNIFPI